MSMALQAEREAIRRYSELAVKMRAADNDSAASLFERMVKEEREHEHLLQDWMLQEGINENPEISPVKWRDPRVATTYDDEARDPYQSSPYRALAFAVHNEEIAFRFYTYVAAEAENEIVRQHAEILAREELGHAALLKAERRRAYHIERNNNHIEPVFDPRLIHNKIDLLTVAIHIDRYLLNAMSNIGKHTSQIKSLINDTQQQLSHNEEYLSTQAAAGESTLNMLKQLKSYHAYLDSIASKPGSELKRLWSCCDRSFAFYDSIVETASNESVMQTAQKLTASALDRIAALKHIFGNLSISDDSVS